MARISTRRLAIIAAIAVLFFLAACLTAWFLAQSAPMEYVPVRRG